MHMSTHPRDNLGFVPISTPLNGLQQQPFYMFPLSRDSLGSAPIEAAPNGLHEQHWHKSTHPRDSLGFAPIATLPNGLGEQHWHMSTDPRDSLGFAPIAIPPNGLQQQLGHKSGYPKGPLGFWPIVAPPNGLRLQPKGKFPFYHRDSPGSWPFRHLQITSTNSLFRKTTFQHGANKRASKEGAICDKRIGRTCHMGGTCWMRMRATMHLLLFPPPLT